MQIRGDMKLDAEIYGLLDEYTDYSKDLQDLLDQVEKAEEQYD